MAQTKEQRKASYQRHKDARIAAVKDYQRRNKEAISTSKRAYNEAHKEEKSARDKRYRRDNPQRIKALMDGRREATRQWLRKLKEEPCQDCGRSFPFVCMDFHHVEPRAKTGRKRIHVGWSRVRIEEELRHCALLCACCHRIRDAAALNLKEAPERI